MALFITRSTRIADSEGPTAPTITAAPASTSSITIERTIQSTDVSGVAYYETQRSAQGAGAWTTFDSSSTSPLTASGLSASTTYDFRQRAFDALGNAGSFSAVVSAATQAASSSETVGAASALNLATSSIYRIDSAAGAVPFFVVEGGTHSYLPTGAWDGGPCHRITPIPIGGGPTGEGMTGMGLFDLRNASLSILKLNFRWEFSFGSTWIQRLNQMTKWGVVNASSTPTGDRHNERPMIYLSDMDTQAGGAPAALQRSDLMAIGVASGTIKNFEPLQAGYAGSNWPRGNEDFYFGPSETVIAGKRIVPATAWYTAEVEIIAESTAQWPNGLIRVLVWNRAGQQLTDLYCPWNWDGNWTVGNDFLTAVETIGGYGNATTVDANTYQLLANFTFAANRPGQLNPRAGFVQV